MSSNDSVESAIALVDTPCPLCGCEPCQVVQHLRDYVYGLPGDFVMVRCAGCQHLYLNPRPTDGSLMQCYPAEYAPYHATLAAATQQSASESEMPPQSRSLVRRGLSFIPGLKRFLYWLGLEHATYLPAPPNAGRSRMLEIGCADGWFLAQAAALGWVVDGIEPSPMAAAKCVERGLQVQCGMFADVDIHNESREAVMLWMVLEHVTDPLGLLAKVQRILAAGGLLAFSVPNGGGLERRLFGKYWLGYEAPRHLQVFTARSIRRLLRDQGYEQITIIHQASTRYWLGSVAAWGMERFPNQQWPRQWMAYFLAEPPVAWRWMMFVPGKLVSLLRCSGRITVMARKPQTGPRAA